MTFIDVHCHLDLLEEKVVENARKKNVRIIVANSTDFDSMKKVLKLSEKHPEVISALGVYPIKSLKLSQKEFQKNLDFIKENSEKISAIGEVGMDFKEDEIHHDLQKK